jgi:transposase
MAAISLRKRILIEELSQLGESDQQIAAKVGVSLATVGKWRRRQQQPGTSIVNSQMGRPKRGALSTYPVELVAVLRKWRTNHPGWGPNTLWAELSKHPAWQGQPLPSRASIARWLKAEGYVKHYEKHGRLPQVVSPARYCHEEWEMDAKGHEPIPSLGLISLIQVNDVYSRAKLVSYPCWVGQERIERYPNTGDYQLVLRRAFVEWGLPDRLAVDRAHVFFDVNTETPFPTHFHLWMLALGVQVTFGRPAQPRDQAMTERSHQTWWWQAVQGQSFDQLEQLWQALETRRSFLNEDLPCRTLDDQAPLVAFPQARQPRRPYRPEWEENLLDLQRIYTFLGPCHWVRVSSSVGTVSLGGHNYSLGKDWYNREVNVCFDPQQHTFIFIDPSRSEKRLPIRWLSKAFLMGEFSPVACFSQLQLMLPFSLEAFRTCQLARLNETLPL